MNAIRTYLQLNLEAIAEKELNMKELRLKEQSYEKEIQTSYKLWLSNLKECLRKSCFRRVLGMILKMPKEFLICYDYFEVEILRLRCIIKIIEHKANKYIDELRENRLKEKRNIEFWINQMYFSLNHIILELRPDINGNTNAKVILNPDDKMDRIEYTIYYFLYALYELILYSEKINKVTQMCAYLTMCSRLDSFIIYCRKPKTIQLYITIALFKSRLFIQNADYQNALASIENTMTLCFRQCFLLVDFDQGLNDHSFDYNTSSNKKYDNSILLTCFLHIVTAFYQRGICYEFQGNISKSIEAYKQSKWISTKFIKSSLPSLSTLFINLLRRALCYHEVIRDIVDYDNRLKERIKKENMNRRLIEQNESEGKKRQRELLQRIANGDQANHSKRLDQTAEIISKIDIKEIELNDKKDKLPKSKYITSTLNLIDYLLNDSFRPILKQMSTIELHCLDLDTKRKIEKQINQLPDEGETMKKKILKIKENSNKENDKKLIHNSVVHQKFNPSTAKALERSTTRSTILKSAKNSLITNQVQMVKVDNTFDNNYRKKKDYLEKYNSKEIKFHKNLLRSKINEVNEKPNTVIAQLVKNNAENFIKLRLLSAKEGASKRILRNYDSQRTIHFFEKQNQLENQVLKSLSTKSYGEYQKNMMFSFRTLNTSKSQSSSLGLSYYERSMKSNSNLNPNLDMIRKLEFDAERLDWIKKKKIKKAQR